MQTPILFHLVLCLGERLDSLQSLYRYRLEGIFLPKKLQKSEVIELGIRLHVRQLFPCRLSNDDEHSW